MSRTVDFAGRAPIRRAPSQRPAAKTVRHLAQHPIETGDDGHGDHARYALFLHRKEAHPQELREARERPRGAVPARDAARVLSRVPAGRRRRPMERKNEGLQAAFTSIFPISSHSGNARLEFVSYSLLPPAFDVIECQQRGLTYCSALRAKVRLMIMDTRSAQGHRQGSEGAGGLHGRDSAHDRQRLVHHQRHRARHRLAAAPLAGRVLRARPRQDALVGQAAVLGARHSLSRLVARLRVRPEGLPVLPRRPPPQDAGDDAAEGDRPHQRGHPARSSSCSTRSTCRRRASQIEFVPERLRGEMARFDIVGKDGKVVVAKDKRITARHMRELADSRRQAHRGADRLRRRPHRSRTNVVDTTTGEMLAKANDEVTEDAARRSCCDAGIERDPDDLHERPRPGRRTSRRRCAPTTRRTSTPRASRSTA